MVNPSVVNVASAVILTTIGTTSMVVETKTENYAEVTQNMLYATERPVAAYWFNATLYTYLPLECVVQALIAFSVPGNLTAARMRPGGRVLCHVSESPA